MTVSRSYPLPDLDAAIGITVYRPNPLLLFPLVEAAVATRWPTYICIDGSDKQALDDYTSKRLRQIEGLTILQTQQNSGVGSALNALVVQARCDQMTAILLLDQDSDLPVGLPYNLLEGMKRLRSLDHRVAAIGPRPVAATGSGTKAPHYRIRSGSEGSLRTVDFVITSGALIDLDAYRAVGRFRSSFKMDMIDVEWCFRAWSKGYSVWFDETEALPHRVGSGTVHLGPINFHRQSLERMVSYFEARTFALRLRHMPLRWKVFTTLYIPIQIAAYVLHQGGGAYCLRKLMAAALRGLRREREDV